MTTIRVARRRKFTTIDRATLNDSRLSFRARGILAWLLDKPDDWTTNSEKITAAGREGRDATRAALTELETLGYLARRKWRDAEDGKYHHEWTVRERPAASEPPPISRPWETSGGEPPAETQRRETRPLTEDKELKTDIRENVFKADWTETEHPHRLEFWAPVNETGRAVLIASLKQVGWWKDGKLYDMAGPKDARPVYVAPEPTA